MGNPRIDMDDPRELRRRLTRAQQRLLAAQAEITTLQKKLTSATNKLSAAGKENKGLLEKLKEAFGASEKQRPAKDGRGGAQGQARKPQAGAGDAS